MFSRWPIRTKLLRGVALLGALMFVLSASTFYGRYAYRNLAKNLGQLKEVGLVNDLVRGVSRLRLTACRLSQWREHSTRFRFSETPQLNIFEVRDTFRDQIAEVREVAARYRDQLRMNAETGSRLGGGNRELRTLGEIDVTLAHLDGAFLDPDWGFHSVNIGRLRDESQRLQDLTGQLPHLLRHNINGFTVEVRRYYRTFLVLAYVSLLLTLVVFLVLGRLVYCNVIRPLNVLAEGSRRVAAGEFDHQIRLDTDDEMGELATSLNAMTARFRSVRDQLDREVQQRTRFILQTERMASDGFLAAGVSHEINNPLASIAMSAESLERRLTNTPLEEMDADMRSYLAMISSEATRCQDITAKLLDFSPMGSSRTDESGHEPTRLQPLIHEVVQVAQAAGRGGPAIDVAAHEDLVVRVNPKEIKQVVLNLVTNALASIDDDGRVQIELRRRDESAEIVVRDNGCGMTDEVLEHLFEPFFTRRAGGGGTGLGLSISHRIIADHGGQIDAASDGPGQGAEFRVRLPLALRGAMPHEPPRTAA